MFNFMKLTNFTFLFNTYLIIIGILVLIGCDSDINNKNLIEEEVKYKINRHIANKLKKCRIKALVDAEIFVDSIITEVTNNAVNKNIDFPDKPEGRDTSSSEFDIKIDSVDLDDIVDSFRINKDAISRNIDLDSLIK